MVYFSIDKWKNLYISDAVFLWCLFCNLGKYRIRERMNDHDQTKERTCHIIKHLPDRRHDAASGERGGDSLRE